jgi:hypothetical protein
MRSRKDGHLGSSDGAAMPTISSPCSPREPVDWEEATEEAWEAGIRWGQELARHEALEEEHGKHGEGTSC